MPMRPMPGATYLKREHPASESGTPGWRRHSLPGRARGTALPVTSHWEARTGLGAAFPSHEPGLHPGTDQAHGTDGLSGVVRSLLTIEGPHAHPSRPFERW